MGNPNPSPTTRFQHGHQSSGGRPKLPEHLKGIREIGVDEVRRTIAHYFKMPYEEVEALLEAKKNTALETMIMSCMKRCVRLGDYAPFAFLLDRTIGKIKEQSEDEGKYDRELEKVPREQLMELLKKTGTEG